MYTLKDVYPDMGSVNTFGFTLPEPEEQNALAHVAEEDTAPKAVDPVKQKSIWTWVLVLVGIIVLFQMGR